MERVIEVVYRAAFDELTEHFNGVLRTIEAHGLSLDSVATYFAMHRMYTIKLMPQIMTEIMAARNAPQVSWVVNPNARLPPPQQQHQPPPAHNQSQMQAVDLSKAQWSETHIEVDDDDADWSYNPGSPCYSPVKRDWDVDFTPSTTSTPRRKRRAQTPGP